MANNFFRFKQFTVYQNDRVLKVSTDSVLLGAWLPAGDYKKILDVGTGTGLLALMMAQRFPKSEIDAVEIDPESAAIAGKNFSLSSFQNRIKLFVTSIQEFSEKQSNNGYHLIISNPPYFENQKPAASEKKNIQKHNKYLSSGELAAIVKLLLEEEGVFALILPPKEGEQFIATARFHGLYCIQMTEVFVRSKQTQPKRRLLLFSKNQKPLITSKLFLENDMGGRSKEFQNLTSSFYL